MKLIVCMTPAALCAWVLSPVLWRHGSSAAFEMAIGLPIFVAFVGFYAWIAWTTRSSK
jgi:hypothetical protein